MAQCRDSRRGDLIRHISFVLFSEFFDELEGITRSLKIHWTPPPLRLSLYFCVCREELASRVRLTDNAALKLQLRLNHRDQNILNILNEPREYNGMCNNLNHPHGGGATLSTMRRLLPPDYADGNSNYPKEICKLIQPLISKRKSQTKSNQNKQMARH
jgi:hypothetical protein